MRTRAAFPGGAMGYARRVKLGDDGQDGRDSLWIFGYGSLVWRPAFPHRCRRAAFVEGYARRFWQGSTDHRGVPQRPGRVVTLLADGHESLSREPDYAPAPCWGTAYEVPLSDPDGVLLGLDHRERGGYDRIELEVYLPGDKQGDVERVRGLVYVAGPDNPNYLGAASIDAIARQVATARGPSGANPEYVFELAGGLREMGARDDHVFAVARALEGLVGPQGRGAS